MKVLHRGNLGEQEVYLHIHEVFHIVFFCFFSFWQNSTMLIWGPSQKFSYLYISWAIWCQVFCCIPCGKVILIWWLCFKAARYSEELNSHRHGMTGDQGWLILCCKCVSLSLIAHRAIQVLTNNKEGIHGACSLFAFSSSGTTHFWISKSNKSAF